MKLTDVISNNVYLQSIISVAFKGAAIAKTFALFFAVSLFPCHSALHLEPRTPQLLQLLQEIRAELTT